VANQIALVVIKNLASPGSGWVDAYAKAFIIFQLPHGLLAVSLATTLVPELSRLIHSNDEPSFALRMNDGIRFTAMLTIPAAVGLFLLAKPIVGALLQHGNFDAIATTNTARALSGLALGVGGFSVYLFVLRGFYARNDTRTPFLINLVENALNIVFALLLVDRFDVLGLGIAYSLAYLISASRFRNRLLPCLPHFGSNCIARSTSINTFIAAFSAVGFDTSHRRSRRIDGCNYPTHQWAYWLKCWCSCVDTDCCELLFGATDVRDWFAGIWCARHSSFCVEQNDQIVTVN